MKFNIANLGWIVAAALGAVLVGGGFQSSSMKVATADLDKIMQGSDYWKTNEASYNDFMKKRQDLLQYISQNRMMSSDEVTKVKTLWLTDSPTAEQTAQLERLKADVNAEQKRQNELSIKQSPTPEERTLLATFARRTDANNQTLTDLEQQFTQDIQDKKTSILNTAMDKARQAVIVVGKTQGYTIVFSSGAAPYAANDITDDATKAMNAQKQ